MRPRALISWGKNAGVFETIEAPRVEPGPRLVPRPAFSRLASP